jgi:hypothetical protein
MKKLKLTPELLKEFNLYIFNCLYSDSIIYGDTLSTMLFLTLKDIEHSIEKKQLDVIYKNTKKITLTISYIQIVTLSYMFNKVPVTPYLSGLEFEILKGVEKQKTNAA